MERVWECRAAIEGAGSPVELWIELADEFAVAHARPTRPQFARAVREYAAW
jgi:hypothetical protein